MPCALSCEWKATVKTSEAPFYFVCSAKYVQSAFEGVSKLNPLAMYSSLHFWSNHANYIQRYVQAPQMTNRDDKPT